MATRTLMTVEEFAQMVSGSLLETTRSNRPYSLVSPPKSTTFWLPSDLLAP